MEVPKGKQQTGRKVVRVVSDVDDIAVAFFHQSKNLKEDIASEGVVPGSELSDGREQLFAN